MLPLYLNFYEPNILVSVIFFETVTLLSADSYSTVT